MDRKENQLWRIDCASTEVKQLLEDGYIPHDVYVRVEDAFGKKKSVIKDEMLKNVSNEQVTEKEVEKNRENQTIARTQNSMHQAPKAQGQRTASDTPSTPIHNPVLIKEKRSSEEERERRLTYILSSGVALILLGGILLALTNWLFFSEVVKVLLVSGVAVLFAGMGYVAHKLKIRQTALAFLLLFAFFTPIVFFSISFYGILGTYLSMEGEGSALFAAVAAFGCCLLYTGLYKFQSHRAFQIAGLVAVGVSVFSFVAFLTASIEMYVLTIALIACVQLLCWKKVYQAVSLGDYRRLFPSFVLGQILLLIMIQLTFGSWTSFVLVNYALLGGLLYWCARLHHPFRVLATPGVLLFGFGITGALFTFHGQNPFLALTLLILPVLLFIVYEWERKQREDKDLIGILRVLFFVTVGLTHVYGQWMVLADSGNSLYIVTLVSLSGLLVSHGWADKKREVLFAAFFISAYTVWFVLNDMISDLLTQTGLTVGLLSFIYAVGLFVKTLDQKAIRRPLRLAAILGIGFVLGQLLFVEEFGLMTGVLLFMCMASMFFVRYEEIKYTYVAGMISVLTLIVAVFAFYPVAWGVDLSAFVSLVSMNHFYFAALLVTAMVFLYRRIYGKQVANVAFALAGFLYGISFIILLNLWQSSFFFTNAPLWVTVYMLGGVAYFLFAVFYVFKEEKKYWWGVALFSTLVYFSLLNYPFSSSGAAFWTIILLSGCLFVWFGRSLKQKFSYGGESFYNTGQLLLVATSVVYLFESWMGDVSIHGLLIPMACLLVEVTVCRRGNEWRFPQAVMIACLLFVHNASWFFELNSVTVADSFVLTGTLMILAVLRGSSVFKKYGYLLGIIVLNAYAPALFLFESNMYGYGKIAVVLLIAAGTLYALEEKLKRGEYVFVPLLLAGLVVLFSSLSPISLATLLFGLAIISLCASVYYVGWSARVQGKINTYQIANTILMVMANLHLRWAELSSIGYELVLSSAMFFYFVLLLVRETDVTSRYVKASAVLAGFYYPYALVLTLIGLADELLAFAYIVPFTLLVSVLLYHVARDETWRSRVESCVVIVSFIVMSFWALGTATLNSSVALSLIAVLAVLGGFYLKFTAYFITGVVVLLVNTIYATRTFWTSIPWWVYLMVVGAILIGFATYQELKKRGDATPLREQVKKVFKQIKARFSNWH
ncbi:hypothetical protein NSQ26_12395 [Bacillus sp. FSL W7-1360]